MHLIQQVSPRPRHSTFPAQGLPQENQDSSRTIAHSLLGEIDDCLDGYGAAGNYVRYTDDMLVGVATKGEGERVVRTIQLALEELGLHPNSAKTKITPSAEYVLGLCPDENGFLDSIQSEIRQFQKGDNRAVQGFPIERLKEVEERTLAFRSLLPEHRPVRWDRVLRRYYTVLRNLRSPLLLADGSVFEDIASVPSGARSFLEYVRSFPLSTTGVQSLFGMAFDWVDLYEDLTLAIFEAVLTAPNDGSTEICAQIASDAVGTLAELRTKNPRREFLDIAVASLFVIIGKFGSENHLAALKEHWRTLERGSAAWMQGLVILIGTNAIPETTLDGPAPAMTWTTAQNWSIVRALVRGDRTVANYFYGLVAASLRLQPLRQYVHPRALVATPLLDLAADTRWTTVRSTVLARLAENEPSLRDVRSMHLLGAQANGTTDKLLTTGPSAELSTPSASP